MDDAYRFVTPFVETEILMLVLGDDHDAAAEQVERLTLKELTDLTDAVEILERIVRDRHQYLADNPDAAPDPWALLDAALGEALRAATHEPVVGLTTLQFSSGGLFDGEPVDDYAVHLVRRAKQGTPGPTLCGIDRFAKGSAGWSVGGGLTGPNIVHTPCPDCLTAAQGEFAGLPVRGSIGAKEMRAALTATSEAVAS